MSDNSRQVVDRKPFSEVLDRYLEIKLFGKWLRQQPRLDLNKLRDANAETDAARAELDNYLNEKE